MEIYSREEISSQKNLRKYARIAMAAVSAAAVLFCVILLVKVTPLTETRFRIMGIAAAAVAGCFDIYISSYVLPYMRPKPKKRGPAGKVLKVLWNIVNQIHMYLIWIILSAVIVMFLFNAVTDAAPAKKVVVFADVETVKSAELETVLNEDLPEGIKLTKVHTFSYSVFGSAKAGDSDIYIVKESDIPQYLEGFGPIEGFEIAEDAELYEYGGIPYGIKIYDSASRGAASDFFSYEEEDYYLFFGKESAHYGPGGAAEYIAKCLLKLR